MKPRMVLIWSTILFIKWAMQHAHNQWIKEFYFWIDLNYQRRSKLGPYETPDNL